MSSTHTSPRFASGIWMYQFGPGSTKTKCRIVIDLQKPAVIAAQASCGESYVFMTPAEVADLSSNVIEANGAHQTPACFGLHESDEMPDWAQPQDTVRVIAVSNSLVNEDEICSVNMSQMKDVLLLKAKPVASDSICASVVLSLGLDFNVCVLNEDLPEYHWAMKMAIDPDDLKVELICGALVAERDCYVPIKFYDWITVKLSGRTGFEQEYEVQSFITVPNRDGNDICAPEFRGEIWMVKDNRATPEAVIFDCQDAYSDYSNQIQDQFGREFEAVMAAATNKGDLAKTALTAISHYGSVVAKTPGDMALITADTETTFRVANVNDDFIAAMAASLNTDNDTVRAAFTAALSAAHVKG